MLEDKLLVWKLRKGSWEALSRIYDRYRDDLLRLATALLNDTSAAEDIVQDVFLRFAESADRLRFKGNVKAYLATCVVNRARNRNRDDIRHRTAVLDDRSESAVDCDRPDRWVVRSEELKRIGNAIGQLPYEQREVIVLHLHGGLRFSQIATLRNISIRTIQSRYRYGLDKLRSSLNGEVVK